MPAELSGICSDVMTASIALCGLLDWRRSFVWAINFGRRNECINDEKGRRAAARVTERQPSPQQKGSPK
jgi:hypothetical protein